MKDDIFSFSKDDLMFLRRLGDTPDGAELVQMFNKMKPVIADSSEITGDYGAQVEGRKLAKKFIVTIVNAMTKKEQSTQDFADDDDYE